MNAAERSWLEGLEQGDRLPRLALPSADGSPVRLRGADRRATVLVGVHSASCPGCRRYLDEIDAAASSLELWGARLLALVPGGVENARALKSETGLSFRVVAAAKNAPAADTPAEDAVVLIADRWGEIYHVARSGAGHELPIPPELEEWLRFLATQCPECGVPDSPGRGAWEP